MPIDVPIAKAEQHDESLDFVSVLRDCLSCAVVTLNERQTVVAFNHRAEQLTSLKADSVIGQGLDVLPLPLQQIVREGFSSGQSVSDRRIIVHNAKRGNLAVQVSAFPTRDEDGRPSGIVVVLNDISSVRKWESNMRRLDRLHSVGTLSASMAHEIRNALVPIKTFVDLLLEKNKDSDLADTVRAEVGRISSIVGQMLKFSGPATPTFASVHVHTVLNKTLLLIQHLLDDKKITLTRSFNAAPDLVDGDANQLEQALLNLFFNALDAMDAKGKLEVVTEILPPNTRIEGLPPAGDRRLLRILISDTGIGIPAENMERLFEPFFTTKPDGTGLGLAITHRIIQEHQGVITVTSEPNRGTAFSVILPVRDEAS
jgi:signal transduction histidine kinase